MTSPAASSECDAVCSALDGRAGRAWRAHRNATLVAVLLSLLAGVLTGLAWAVIAGALRPGTALARGLALAGSLAGLAAGARTAWSLPRGRELAAWAAHAVGAARCEGLRTALELASRWRAGERAMSAQLTAVTVRRARPLMGLLDAAVGRERSRNLRLGATVSMLVLALLWSMRAQPASWSSLLRGAPARPRPPVVVGTLVGDQTMRIDPPDYAAEALVVRDEQGDPGPILCGSRVTVRARPLEFFAALEVVIRQGSRERRIRLDPTAAQLAWHFAARVPLRFRYRAVDPGGRCLVERAWREVRVRSDRPPKVELSLPEGETEVHSGERVMVQGAAEDDIGLAGLELVVALPGGGLKRRPVAFAPRDRRAEVRETLEVDRLGLRAGEFASVFLEASDRIGGEGRRVASRRALLRMFSPEGHHGRVIEELAELALRWTTLLADRLEHDPGRARIGLRAALTNRAELARAEREGLHRLDAVLRRLGEDVLALASTAANLREIGELIRNRLADEERTVRRAGGHPSTLRARRWLAALRRMHTHMIAAQERAVVLLVGLSAAEHRQAVVRQSRTLEGIEDKLAETLARLASKGETGERAEAERLLATVSAQIERMLAAMARQMPVAPAEHFNPGGVDDPAARGALRAHRDALSRVRELIRRGDFEAARRELASLRERLGRALRELRERAERETTGAQAALRRLVKHLRAGIDAARREQAMVREAARPASEQQRRRLAERLERTVRQALPGVLALLDDARDQVRPRRLGSARGRANRAVGRARAAMSTARSALDHRELDGALRAMAESAEQLARAQGELAAGPDDAGVARDLLESDRDRVRLAADRVGRAAALLREALPAPAALLDPGNHRRLRELEPRQRGIRRRLRRVRKRLAREAGAHPALQSHVGRRVDHAMAMMRQAERSMRGGDGVAVMEQTAEADAALERAARMLAPPRRASSPIPGSAVGAAPPRQRIEIGVGGPADRRRSYRRALLEAMKRRAPAGYRERLRRYYESISR